MKPFIIKYRKLLPCLLLGLCFLSSSRAQGGFFNQNGEMRKNLIKQITLFQVYLGYLKKGYNITNQGIGLVRDGKNGEFSLHKGYFGSLKAVNPKIKNYSKVAGIISYQLSILQQYNEVFRRLKTSKSFGPEEIRYCSDVYSNLLAETGKGLDELMLLTTAGKLELSDEERIKRLDKLYIDMQDKHAFIQHFNKQAQMLALQRGQELFQIEQQRKLRGF